MDPLPAAVRVWSSQPWSISYSSIPTTQVSSPTQVVALVLLHQAFGMALPASIMGAINHSAGRLCYGLKYKYRV